MDRGPDHTQDPEDFTPEDLVLASTRLAEAPPEDIIRWSLRRFGEQTSIAFSGAEDVALIEMASRTGLPFQVFCLDTGRLHPQTLRFLERVREHYGIPLHVVYPDAAELEAFVRTRGLFSFYDEGHAPCCDIRKVRPLKRFLSGIPAWITGQRRDQSPGTRAQLAVVEWDALAELAEATRIKVNPLAAWTSEQVWDFLRRERVPTNPLHAEGYRSIGCEPCTRAVGPEQHEREGRWWWEDKTKKECGLHFSRVDEAVAPRSDTGSET